jgi:hypothetical protein
MTPTADFLIVGGGMATALPRYGVAPHGDGGIQNLMAMRSPARWG